jgi:hypothetical protein
VNAKDLHKVSNLITLFNIWIKMKYYSSQEASKILNVHANTWRVAGAGL